MSRQLEQEWEDKARRDRESVTAAVCGGLVLAVAHGGGELVGLSLKITDFDALMTVRAAFPGGRMIAFVGAGDMAECFKKATREAKMDALRWKPDKYAKE
jgi:hypothetical protein